jgi:energy-converting hydrogenase A subunit I
MKNLKLTSYLMFVISILGIAYALIFNPVAWIVYGISIVFIPLFILSLGLIVMARSTKDEEDERVNEPFIGY